MNDYNKTGVYKLKCSDCNKFYIERTDHSPQATSMWKSSTKHRLNQISQSSYSTHDIKTWISELIYNYYKSHKRTLNQYIRIIWNMQTLQNTEEQDFRWTTSLKWPYVIWHQHIAIEPRLQNFTAYPFSAFHIMYKQEIVPITAEDSPHRSKGSSVKINQASCCE